MFFFKLIIKFYKTFIITASACFIYNLGAQKGYKNQITLNENLLQIQEYIDVTHYFFTISLVNYIQNLINLNVTIISFICHIFFLVLFIILIFFISFIYVFITNFIDRKLLYKWDLNICQKCGSNIKTELKISNKSKKKIKRIKRNKN